MKEVYWEIKINKPGPRFLPELSLSGPAKVVYFDLPIYFLHEFISKFNFAYFIILFIFILKKLMSFFIKFLFSLLIIWPISVGRRNSIKNKLCHILPAKEP